VRTDPWSAHAPHITQASAETVGKKWYSAGEAGVRSSSDAQSGKAAAFMSEFGPRAVVAPPGSQEQVVAMAVVTRVCARVRVCAAAVRGMPEAACGIVEAQLEQVREARGMPQRQNNPPVQPVRQICGHLCSRK